MEPGRPDFETSWPELASRLTAALRRRGVSPWLVEDIVQETGFRLFKMWDSVDPDNSPWGLTLTIAKNLLWDEKHRRASRELLIDLPEQATTLDVERAGIARLELWRVSRAMRKMSDAHRTVLLAEVGGQAVGTRSAAATKMLRMRARRKLTALLDSVSASCLATLGALRKQAFGFQQFLRRATTPGVEGSASMTVVAIVSAVIVMVPTQGVTAPSQNKSRAVPPAQLLTAGDTVADGWDAARPGDARSTTTREPATKKRAADDTLRHELSFGDDNVGGRARVRSRKSKSNELFTVPRCAPDTSRPDQITIRCSMDANGEHHEIEFTFKRRPPIGEP